jgi:aminoglycoside phosphotransferase (APT) family kinase protein
MMRIATDPSLSQGLRSAREGWRNLCLIHADLKHDNILLIEDADSPRVAIIDWEMARVGDPAWDLAGLAARLPMTALGNDSWSARTVEGVTELLSAYAKASRLPAPALAQRLPGYMATWLVMSAIQHQSTLEPGHPDEGAEELLTKATQGFKRKTELARSLIEVIS